MPITVRLLMVFSGILLALVLVRPMPVTLSAATTEQPLPLPSPTVTPSVTPTPTLKPVIPTDRPTQPATGPGVSESSRETQLYGLINEYRQSRGLTALSIHSNLSRSAHAKAADMIANNYWSHVSPSGKADWDFFKEAGYSFTHAGENLADNYFSPQDVLNAWKASGPHNENLLKSVFTEMGLAYVCDVKFHGYQSTCLIVLHLGSRS